MSRLPLVVLIATVALLAMGLVRPTQLGTTVGLASGSALPGMLHASTTPEDAVRSLFDDVRRRDFNRAYSQVANSSDVALAAFTRDLTGTHGSLKTYSGLESFETQLMHATDDDALVRVRLHWATAVGAIYEMRDLKVVREGQTWKVVWPAPSEPKVPPQVVPVTYLRWDVINRGPEDDWGTQNVDAPRVRIISMSAADNRNGVVVLGEIVNEDTVPAFVDVNATLLDAQGNPLAQESSFDKISHTLLPAGVSPYRIDFPGMKLDRVKSVRMDAKALLVPASADPVIAILNQRLDTAPQGKQVLRGELVNQSGQVVNISQVLATYYDNNGKVIWVSSGYVDQALLPQMPQPFQLEIPEDIAARVQTYRVVVNHYNSGQS